MLHEQSSVSTWDLSCFYGSLPMQPDKTPRCKLLELYEQSVDCEALGRSPVNHAYTQAVAASLRRTVGDGEVCEILPFQGDPADPQSPMFACLNDLHLALKKLAIATSTKT
jgi:hypothetical protein